MTHLTPVADKGNCQGTKPICGIGNAAPGESERVKPEHDKHRTIYLKAFLSVLLLCTGIVNPAPVQSQEEMENTPLSIGELHTSDGFAIGVASVHVGVPQVQDLFGRRLTPKAPDLLVNLVIKNTSERKILRFRKANQFGPSDFELQDDVGNRLRGVSYGATNKIVGSLTGSEDINPGQLAGHLLAFSVPLPKTEHLVLTINTQCFGGSDIIKFQIPMKDVKTEQDIERERKREKMQREAEAAKAENLRKQDRLLDEISKLSEAIADERKARQWTDATGAFSVKATFVDFNGRQLQIKRSDNNQVINIPAEKLSDDSIRVATTAAKVISRSQRTLEKCRKDVDGLKSAMANWQEIELGAIDDR